MSDADKTPDDAQKAPDLSRPAEAMWFACGQGNSGAPWAWAIRADMPNAETLARKIGGDRARLVSLI